jgi:eight-cysteine-cluster-containing protein
MDVLKHNQAARWIVVMGASTGLALVLHAGVADACSCVPSSVESSYQLSSDVVTARPLFGFVVASEQRYLAQVTATFKGCTRKGQLVLLTTPSSSATCGASLQLGTEYLINGDRDGSAFGLPKLGFNLCGYNLPADELSAPDREFLDGRTVCCGDECRCADGSQPVACFANPCDVTPACQEAARCEANYCGGCNAEFYDEGGRAVCEPEPEPGACSSDSDCVQTGCSGQICASEDVITTCEFREEFACFQDPAITTCGCDGGRCAFAATPELEACLAAAGDGGE